MGNSETVLKSEIGFSAAEKFAVWVPAVSKLSTAAVCEPSRVGVAGALVCQLISASVAVDRGSLTRMSWRSGPSVGGRRIFTGGEAGERAAKTPLSKSSGAHATARNQWKVQPGAASGILIGGAPGASTPTEGRGGPMSSTLAGACAVLT